MSGWLWGMGQSASPLPWSLGNFFSTLGVGPAVGRVFSHAPGQDETASAVVVLAHDYWRARFGSDPAVIGRTLLIDPSQLKHRRVSATPESIRCTIPPDSDHPVLDRVTVSRGD